MAGNLRAVRMVLTVLLALGAALAHGQDLPYAVGTWPEAGHGNHRAIVRVASPADAVWAHVPWRRRDTQPEQKAVLVSDAAGQPVANAVTPVVTREAGDIIFQAARAGDYFIYYLPYNPGQANFDDPGRYFPPRATAAPEWLAQHKLQSDQLAAGAWRNLPPAEPVRLEARTEFDRMDPMEVIATAAETQALLAAHPQAPYLLFPEDRRNAIRMTRELPLLWIRRGPTTAFTGQAQPGEYYPFQLGVWACGQPLRDLRLDVQPLRNDAGGVIPADQITCFNLSGNDWLGRPMRKSVAIAAGTVQALWLGVQVPANATGTYRGAVTVRPTGLPPAEVAVTLQVTGLALDDGGVGDLWRLSRLKWLNSKLGLDDQVVAPFTPLQVRGNTISLLNRRVRFGPLGLPDSIVSNNREILAAPMALVVATPGGPLRFADARGQITKQAPATVERAATAQSPGATLRVTSRTEADGCLMFTARLQATRALPLQDVRLELPVRPDCARYLMGMGKRGGFRPPSWRWKWDNSRANNMVWLGDVDAGVQLQLRGLQDTWLPVSWTAADVPLSWSNGGQGGCDIVGGPAQVLVRAYTGARTLRPGEELQLRFRLLVTPFKPIDRNHWSWRYGDVKADGTVLHVHHATPENPYINYPFLKVNELRDTITSVHALRTRRSDFGRLEYPAAGHVDPRRGALHVWTTVNFDPAAGGPQQAQFNQALFSLDWPNEDSVGFYWNIDDRGMRTYVRQGAPTKNQYPVLFGTNSADWKQGERHVLTLSWGDELAVYVDGQLKGRAAYRGLWNAPLDQARLVFAGPGFIVDAVKLTNQPYTAGAPLTATLDDATQLLDTFSNWDGGKTTHPERAAGAQGGALTGAYVSSAGAEGQQINFTCRESAAPPKGVNLYYTVRELSNRVAEMWPLRSLGDEIFPTTSGAEMKVGDVTFGQTGGGNPWLREHLVDGYRVGWRQPLPWLEETDAAIETQGLSRWHNYYIEGLDWLMENTGLDGIYLDGIGYDREIIKRLAKVLYRRNPAARINYHSGDSWSPPWDLDRRVSPANATMEHFPYLSNLWFGEVFDYNMPPDYWLVEMSGIPFGLTGEMLNYENGGNPYRGMVYGMTGRQHPSAVGMWRFWDEFGIQDAEWLGYWSPRCPVKTDSPEVLASVYRKPGDVLVALGHWPSESPRRRTAQAPACATPPVVDGHLAAGEWDGAVTLTGFTAHDADSPAEHETIARVTWNAERLYVGFRCESPLPPRAAVAERDGEVWLDDAMELFVQPEPGSGPYVQFVGNSRDAIFDCRGLGQPQWNGNWTYRSSVGAGAWEGELSIAWSDLAMKPPTPGHVLGLNLCRDQVVPTKALSCWSQVSGAFHDPSQFGQLTLAAAGDTPTAPAARRAGPLAVRLQVNWQALGLNPKHVKVTAPPIAWFQEAREFDVSQPIPVRPGQGWLLRIQRQ